MKRKFDNQQYRALCGAVDALIRNNDIEGHEIGPRSVEVYFDSYQIVVTSPIEGALQFNLVLDDDVLETLLTEQAKEQKPIERAIMSMLGSVMLEAFRNDWDGFTISEGNENGF